MPGKMMFMTFKEAETAGPYDEYPMLPAAVDPQLHLSRNDRPQPFYLVCEKDCVLVQMSGHARVRFASGPQRWFRAEPGDFIYVPAGTPHRIEPESPSVQYRYKARHPGLEAVAWYCEGCGGALWRHTFDTAKIVPQRAYAEACRSFNGDRARRTCAACGRVHDEVEFPEARWREIADELAAAAAA
jgi:mannose-6-phosphate isomerase-like protein (cupin superfamily)